ncbi:MAG: substrate-binding domain-containing protein, partial [Calditrichia bacterium]|nr:substrate-binding domain-containing protein [Calditrichia bacterium]
DYLIPHFEKETGIALKWTATGTGKALKLGQNCDVDLLLVHAPPAEKVYIEKGYGKDRQEIMYNDFVIIGPGSDPAGIQGKNISNALAAVKNHAAPFMSRGDDSGTNKKEKQIWKEAGLNPNTQNNSWYLESGQGQAATLRIADEKNGYVMLDRGTFLFHKSNVRLEVLVEGGKKLLNPYGIIAVNPYKHKHTNYEMAMALITWITSPKCQEMIAKFTVNGNIMFYKNANNQINELSN